MPTARNMARAGARPGPSVTSWERGFIGLVMAHSLNADGPLQGSRIPRRGRSAEQFSEGPAGGTPGDPAADPLADGAALHGVGVTERTGQLVQT